MASNDKIYYTALKIKIVAPDSFQLPPLIHKRQHRYSDFFSIFKK